MKSLHFFFVKMSCCAGLLVVLLSSCKKNNNNSKTGSGPLLYLITDTNYSDIAFFSVDSLSFTYDDKGRLKSRIYNLTPSTTSHHIVASYDRDEKGRTTTISEQTQTAESGVPEPVRNSVTQVAYKKGSDDIQYLYIHTFGEGYDFVDSSVYDYKDGRLSFIRDFILPSTTMLYSNSFVFDGAGDLSTCSFFIGLPGTSRQDYIFQPDRKTNPLKFGLEEIGQAVSGTSSSNVTQYDLRTADNYSATTWVDFVYREDGRPVSAINTFSLSYGAVISHRHYFYKEG